VFVLVVDLGFGELEGEFFLLGLQAEDDVLELFFEVELLFLGVLLLGLQLLQGKAMLRTQPLQLPVGCLQLRHFFRQLLGLPLGSNHPLLVLLLDSPLEFPLLQQLFLQSMHFSPYFGILLGQ